MGAGPAGIMAALEAARRGAEVHVYDTNPMVGRKLLVTGNGRCNISNAHVAAERYACADPSFMAAALSRYGHRETTNRLEELGILTYGTTDGWCYPLSESAATVADAFAAALELAGVAVHLHTKIVDLRVDREGTTLSVGGPSNDMRCDRAIVATGGMAHPALGSDGAFLPVLERLGHTIVPVYPALAPIQAGLRHLNKLQGVRLDARWTLLEGSCVLGETVGNVLFTQSGLSGPAAMDLSYLVSTRPGARMTLSIDLLQVHGGALRDLIARVRGQAISIRVVLGAVLPGKVPPLAMHWAGLPPELRLSDASQGDVDRVLRALGHVQVSVRGTRGFRFCQLSTGGVPVTEVDPLTMGSRVVPNVHLAGEVLDVVGPCGGYNLQFALTSGALSGIGAAEG